MENWSDEIRAQSCSASRKLAYIARVSSISA